MLASITLTSVASGAAAVRRSAPAARLAAAEIAIPRAVPDAGDPHRRQRPEARSERRRDRRARRRGQFHRRAARVNRHAFKNAAVAGAGTGSIPCSVFTVPLPMLIAETWTRRRPADPAPRTRRRYRQSNPPRPPRENEPSRSARRAPALRPGPVSRKHRAGVALGPRRQIGAASIIFRMWGRCRCFFAASSICTRNFDAVIPRRAVFSTR